MTIRKVFDQMFGGSSRSQGASESTAELRGSGRVAGALALARIFPNSPEVLAVLQREDKAVSDPALEREGRQMEQRQAQQRQQQGVVQPQVVRQQPAQTNQQLGDDSTAHWTKRRRVDDLSSSTSTPAATTSTAQSEKPPVTPSNTTEVATEVDTGQDNQKLIEVMLSELQERLSTEGGNSVGRGFY